MLVVEDRMESREEKKECIKDRVDSLLNRVTMGRRRRNFGLGGSSPVIGGRG